jgi:vitamin B12 transporter
MVDTDPNKGAERGGNGARIFSYSFASANSGGSLDADWHFTEAAVLSATLLYVGPWVEVNRAGTVSGVAANGYTLVNLAGSYDLGSGLTADARIDNLLDRHYQDPIGFLRPGLGVLAGVRMAFDVVPPGR